MHLYKTEPEPKISFSLLALYIVRLTFSIKNSQVVHGITLFSLYKNAPKKSISTKNIEKRKEKRKKQTERKNTFKLWQLYARKEKKKRINLSIRISINSKQH